MSTVTATQIVILGGSGDLSQRKLLPALLDLFARGKLPASFHIIGLARSPRSNEEYRDFVKEAIMKHHSATHTHDEETINNFCDRISYVQGSFDEPASYDRLEAALSTYEAEVGQGTNRLFYLAVPPTYYKRIFADLKSSGVADEKADTWTHILVEKPFGKDLATAQALDEKLASLYREDQIFRIDHYLAKEAVQNVLSFRFANTLMKAPWTNESIAAVDIRMKEEIDIGDRVDFYEGVGALRDVGQNHLLQLLALVAMREPEQFDIESIRSARAEALQALRPITPEELEKNVLRAQYDGYQANAETGETSSTETYFEMIAHVDLPQWEGVPFRIVAGKALDEALVSIDIHFKDVASGLFETDSCHSIGNRITLTISPNQTIAITVNAKAPGLGFQLETRTLTFACDKGDSEIKNSYEKVLYDSLIGDQTLFTRTDEVLAAWRFITPILDIWKTLPLHTYEKGTDGPAQHLFDVNA